MTQFKDKIRRLVSARIKLLSQAIIAELQFEWDDYMRYIRGLPPKEQKKLTEYFGVSSLDDLTIEILSSDISEDVINIKFGIDRRRDSRLLEYIYGKRTPLNKLIAKLSLPGGAETLMKKHGLI